MVESGYKFYFHEESAKVSELRIENSCITDNKHWQIASTELGIIAYMKRNLLTASIPVQRKEVHMKK